MGAVNKPGFVKDIVLSSHLSNSVLTDGLKRSTRESASSLVLPYSTLLRMGFAWPEGHPFGRWALTPPFHPYPYCGRYISVALSLSSHSQEFLLHPALRSPDFPPAQCAGGWKSYSRRKYSRFKMITTQNKATDLQDVCFIRRRICRFALIN